MVSQSNYNESMVLWKIYIQYEIRPFVEYRQNQNQIIMGCTQSLTDRLHVNRCFSLSTLFLCSLHVINVISKCSYSPCKPVYRLAIHLRYMELTSFE